MLLILNLQFAGLPQSNMWTLLAFLLTFMVRSGWATQCNKYFGPAGPIECIQIQRYNNQYQWATCLSDAYIKQKSGHKHLCEGLAFYCWYQCMLEVHSKTDGPVTKDCSCDPGSPTSFPYTGNPTTLLPPECYSPPGDSCDWYRNCLEKKYLCEASSNAYAITYAEKFCRMFEERRAKFNANGAKWMDGVRKCLQVSLVPLLRPWNNPTCKEIRAKAFASHTPCYLKPDKDVPSICDLDYSEYLKIFWTIKGTFVNLDTAWESLKGFWNIIAECGPSKIKQTFESSKQKLWGATKFLKIKIQKFKERKRRSTDTLPEADLQSRFADGVGSVIASTLKWKTDVMDWLAYTDAVVDVDNLDIYIALADKKALGIVTTSAPSVDFNQTIQEFASAVETGTLPLQVDGYKVWVKSLASCSDKSCNSTQTLAVSTEASTEASTREDSTEWPLWNGATRISRVNVCLCGAVALLIMVINKLLFYKGVMMF